MKKLVVYFVLCLFLCCVVVVDANAERLVCVWRDLIYTVKRDDLGYTASIIGYRNSPEELVIPDEIQGLRVTEIEDMAFKECKTLRTVEIPGSVQRIGEWAFLLCTNLREVRLAEGVEEIGKYVFSDCSLLQDITIPQSVSVIDDGAFIGCTSLNAITIPDNVDVLGQAAFFGCESLTDIKLPKGLTILPDQLFEGCKALRYIELPADLATIGGRAFLGCIALAEMPLPNGLKKIDTQAFAECRKLKKVVIPDGVTEIGWQAFMDCSSLEECLIPGSVEKIHEEAFSGCSKQLRMNLEAGSYAERYCSENGLNYGERNINSINSNDLAKEREDEIVYTMQDWYSPAVTVVSKGRTNPLNGTFIDPQLFGQILRVEDQVGGWFYFIAPQDGDYSFSVLAPYLSGSSFSIEVYRNESGTNQKICSLKYLESNEVQTQTVKDVKAGTRICWWDNDDSGRGYTLQNPFALMITCQDSMDR